MDRSRSITYGAGLVILALVVFSAWTYLGQTAEDHDAMAGPVSGEEPLPEDHPELSEDSVVSESPAVAPSSVTAEAPPADETPAGGAETFVASDAGGAVNVDAAVLTPGSVAVDETLAPLAEQLTADEFGILLMFNTHSVNLSDYDLVALASLEAQGGEIAPARWISESDDSHHRSGVLVFPAQGIDLAAAGELSLTLRDIDAVPERTLTWALPLG